MKALFVVKNTDDLMLVYNQLKDMHTSVLLARDIKASKKDSIIVVSEKQRGDISDINNWVIFEGILPDKETALILDHSGNTQRLGFATDPLPTTLDDGKKQQSKKPERSEPLPKPCPACKFIKPPKTHACPKCGFAPEKRDDVQVGEGELVLLDGKKRNRTDSWDEKIRFYGGLKGYARKKGYKPGWAIHAYSERYGVLPWDKRLKSAPTVEPGEDVMNFVKWRAIKQRKRA